MQVTYFFISYPVAYLAEPLPDTFVIKTKPQITPVTILVLKSVLKGS